MGISGIFRVGTVRGEAVKTRLESLNKSLNPRRKSAGALCPRYQEVKTVWFALGQAHHDSCPPLAEGRLPLAAADKKFPEIL